MAVSEQTDSLRVLGSDPVDYLITPRTLACMIAGPILNLMCFVMGELLLWCILRNPATHATHPKGTAEGVSSQYVL